MPFTHTQDQMRDYARIRNPLRRWLHSQPLSVTQTTIARDLGIARSTLSEYMRENNAKTPSLKLAVRIERLTQGAVTAYDFADHAASNREVAA